VDIIKKKVLEKNEDKDEKMDIVIRSNVGFACNNGANGKCTN
jgi:hypothetical protein